MSIPPVSPVCPRRTLGLILAGGQSRRMGGQPKALCRLGGIPMLQRVANILRPQVDGLLLNVNGPTDAYAPFGLPMAADPVGQHDGPLAGILCGLLWAEQHGYHQVLSVAVDCPLLPEDLYRRLSGARQNPEQIAMAVSGPHVHPVMALWPLSQTESLRRALQQQGIRAVKRYLENQPCVQAHWPNQPLDPFCNVNTPQDLEAVEAWLQPFHP